MPMSGWPLRRCRRHPSAFRPLGARAAAGQHRRRAGLISAPVFAATAVLAIAVVSFLVTGNGQAPAPTASPKAAPAHFSPLRPYVALSPADRAVAAQSFLLPAYQVFSMRSPTREIGVFAAGQCAPSAGTLTCPRALGAAMLKPSQRTGHLAGKVDGHRAYWSADVGSLSVTVTINQSGQQTGSKPGAGYGVLQWQYARGGWAELAAPSERSALSTARATRVGPAVAAPVRFPVQLVGVPARWKVNSVAETANKWHDTQWAMSAANAPVLTSGLAGSSCAADIGPAGRSSPGGSSMAITCRPCGSGSRTGSMSTSCVPRMRMGST